jgi:autotransporter translocation and assembly factor TamB
LGSGTLTGTLAELRTQGNAQLETQYADHPLHGQIHWDDSILHSHYEWQDRTLALTVESPLGTQPSWQLEATNIQDDDWAPLISALPEWPDFAARHHLTLSGVGDWNSAHIQLTTTHTGLWQDAPIAAHSEGSGHWQSGGFERWQVDDFSVTWQDASVMINAASTRGSWLPDQLHVRFNELPIRLLWQAPDIDGTINGQAQLSSVQSDWSAELTMDLQGQRQAEMLSGQVNLTGQGQDLELTHVDLRRLSIGLGESFALAGQGGLNEEQWDLDLNWLGFIWMPPATWPIPQEPWQASGQLRLFGQDDNPDIELEQVWESVWFETEEVTMPWRLEQTITSHAQHYELSNQLLASDLEQIHLRLQLPRVSWVERIEEPVSDWDWQAQAEWAIALEQWMQWLNIEQWIATGQWQGQGEWDGPLTDLQYRLDTQWQAGTLQFPLLGLEASNLNVQLQGDPEHPLILSGSGQLGAGAVSLQGELDAQSQPWSVDSRIDFTQAAILQRPEVQSTASGYLGLAGQWPELKLTGEVSLDDLQVNLSRIAGSNIPQLDIHNEPQSEPLLWPLHMDIGITTAGLARITGNGLDAALSGDVRLLGTPDAINTEGALTIESGQFNLLTRNFELVEGQLRLVEETIHLFIVAVHQRGDVTIEATLRGPIDALQLSLRSDPMLPEDEIVAQLLFGKTVQNMTPWQALQLASAINQLRGGDSLDLFLATRDSLGLDTLEIETDDDAQAPAVLRIGRYLNSRVYLELDTELDADRGLTGRVEFELTPNLFLETQTGGSGGRLHLRWRRDY